MSQPNSRVGKRHRRESAQRPERAASTEDLLRELQGSVGAFLESSLAQRVISESPHQKTGGGYQTVRLGEGVREGFRMSRPNLLKGFEIEGRTACDLGANLGEIARDLRRAGAAHVDAYEYDPFFTQLARYVTAFNGLSNTNHLEANVAEEGFLRREYDICVGLSAFSFMKQNIDYICEQVSESMIIETHKIRDARWPRRYVAPIVRHFPHWCCFGRVTHGQPGAHEPRLWLAFSKQPLTPFFTRRAATVVPDAEGVIQIDLERSTFSFLDAAKLPFERRSEPLSSHSVRLYSERLDEYERRHSAGEEVELAIRAEPYWLALMCGLAEFADRGLEDDNTHLRWMTRGIAAGALDPRLRPLLDNERRLHRKVSLRLAALGSALRENDVTNFGEVPVVYNPTPFHRALEGLNLKFLAVHGSGERLCASRLNGHHRLFIMKMLNVESCPMMPIWDPATFGQPKTLGRVRNYEQRVYQYLAGVDVDEPEVAAV